VALLISVLLIRCPLRNRPSSELRASETVFDAWLENRVRLATLDCFRRGNPAFSGHDAALADAGARRQDRVAGPVAPATDDAKPSRMTGTLDDRPDSTTTSRADDRRPVYDSGRPWTTAPGLHDQRTNRPRRSPRLCRLSPAGHHRGARRQAVASVPERMSAVANRGSDPEVPMSSQLGLGPRPYSVEPFRRRACGPDLRARSRPIGGPASIRSSNRAAPERKTPAEIR